MTEWRILVFEQCSAALDVLALLAFGFLLLKCRDFAFRITSDFPRIHKLGQFGGWCVVARDHLIVELVVIGSEKTWRKKYKESRKCMIDLFKVSSRKQVNQIELIYLLKFSYATI